MWYQYPTLKRKGIHKSTAFTLYIDVQDTVIISMGVKKKTFTAPLVLSIYSIIHALLNSAVINRPTVTIGYLNVWALCSLQLEKLHYA